MRVTAVSAIFLFQQNQTRLICRGVGAEKEKANHGKSSTTRTVRSLLTRLVDYNEDPDEEQLDNVCEQHDVVFFFSFFLVTGHTKLPMAQPNSDYSVLNVQDIVILIQSLTTFGVQSFTLEKQVTFSVTTPAIPPAPPTKITASGDYLVTILDYKYAGTTDYIVMGGLISGTETPALAKGYIPTIFFGTVAAATPVVLVSSVQLINSLRTPSIIKGTNAYLYFKSEPYLYDFYVSDTDRLREHKAAILNLFSTDMRTYVIFDSLIVHFIQKDKAYQPVFYGLLEKCGRRIESKMIFDWADGVLVGKIGKQVCFYYSKPRFRQTNFYPFMENTDHVSFTIQGGVENYICDTEKNILTGKVNGYDRITIANKDDYQRPAYAPPHQMDTRYIPLAIPITFTAKESGTDNALHLIGFNDANLFYLNNCTNPGLTVASYAVFQTTDYFNIQNSITQSVKRFVTTTDKTKLNVKSITVGCLTFTIYYSFSADVFTLAFDAPMTFAEFVQQTEGSVSIDQLVKCPFYTDHRIEPSNYYSRRLEVEPNLLPPTARIMAPTEYVDGLPFGVAHRYDAEGAVVHNRHAGIGLRKSSSSQSSSHGKSSSSQSSSYGLLAHRNSSSQSSSHGFLTRIHSNPP